MATVQGQPWLLGVYRLLSAFRYVGNGIGRVDGVTGGWQLVALLLPSVLACACPMVGCGLVGIQPMGQRFPRRGGGESVADMAGGLGVV